MKRICVNCGSNSGSHPEYLKSAILLGGLLAEKEIELVYGGAEVGFRVWGHPCPIIAQWHVYQGYFIRENVFVGKGLIWL